MTLEPGSFIWATRGHTWGFRFLRDGGYPDPLPVYEGAFYGIAEERQVCVQVGETIALRFPDPEGRKDRARRVISHDFVIHPSTSGVLPRLPEARKVAWESVSAEYGSIWADSNSDL